MSSALPPQQISGLASGLDTSSIIDAMMAVARQPLVNLQNEQSVEQQRETDLQSIQTQLQTLQTSIESLGDISVWADSQTVTSSNSALLSATMSGGGAAGAFDFNVTQLARAAQSTQQSSLTDANADDTLTISVGSSSVQVAISQGDSIDTIASKINMTADVPVYATELNGKLVLSSRTTGTGNDITVSSTGTLASDLGMSETITPQDTLYTIDGGSQQSSPTNTVTGAMAGLDVTFYGTGDTTLTIGAPAPDTSAITSQIQSFVTTYNQTIDMVSAKLNEQKVVNPQTQADMAKGDLQGDEGLESLLSQLREAVGSAFTENPQATQLLSQAGLSTGAPVGTGAISQSSLQGDLTLDTGTLSSLLSTNFDDVKAMFTNFTNGDYSTEGVSQRLNSIVTDWVEPGGVMAERIQSEQSLVSEMQSEQGDMNQQLAIKQQQLESEFTNMETTMSQEEAQGNWLGASIGSAASPSSTSGSEGSGSTGSTSG